MGLVAGIATVALAALVLGMLLAHARDMLRALLGASADAPNPRSETPAAAVIRLAPERARSGTVARGGDAESLRLAA